MFLRNTCIITDTILGKCLQVIEITQKNLTIAPLLKQYEPMPNLTIYVDKF